MQVVVMLVFLAVWVLVFWLGSIALETTGMERAKARFQALSALSGTGFTTREAESIVNHPGRRRIATWLIFIGNAGIVAFIILMILYVRAGFAAPSVVHVGIILGIIVVVALLIKLRVIDRLTNGIMQLVRRGHAVPHLVTEELLHQAGDHGVAHVLVRKQDAGGGITLKDTGLTERGITVLSIERGKKVLPFPKEGEAVQAGDYLLCYGEVAGIIGVAQ
ncbi:MAG: hypothetical protein JW732_07695 [Dehalococcoidia bacterium]|nr:hypothetical protein [Dehalococcoidia bacterium]